MTFTCVAIRKSDKICGLNAGIVYEGYCLCNKHYIQLSKGKTLKVRIKGKSEKIRMTNKSEITDRIDENGSES